MKVIKEKGTPTAVGAVGKGTGVLMRFSTLEYNTSVPPCQDHIANRQYDPLLIDAALESADADLKAAQSDDAWISAYLRWIELHTLKVSLKAAEVTP